MLERGDMGPNYDSILEESNGEKYLSCPFMRVFVRTAGREKCGDVQQKVDCVIYT